MRELCDEFDALLIFDEVQTGCGLTGNRLGISSWMSHPTSWRSARRRWYAEDGHRRGGRGRRQCVCGPITAQLDMGVILPITKAPAASLRSSAEGLSGAGGAAR